MRGIAARLRGQRGATAVEYSIMVSLIAVVIITAVVLLGQTSKGQYECAGNSLIAKTNQC